VVAQQEPERPAGVLEIHQQGAGQLAQPLAARVRSDAEDADPAGGMLEDEEAVQPGQGHRLEVEQVAGENPVVGGEELPPARPGPPRRRLQAGRRQDAPYRRGPDP
jgi:hypothetical protein